MSAAPRLLAGRYRLDEPLGHGGMGTVWRAHDERLARDVAIKVLGPQSGTDPAAAERFEREARTLAALDHPGVVRVHDFGVDPAAGGAFLIMELLPGPSLAEVLAQQGQLPIAQAARYGAEIAEALAAAHAAGIVHRDVKPGNLVLDSTGSVRLVDFGIARSGTGEATLTGTGTVMGSAAYMAPELASGQSASPRSDLYSLGCVLMALVTGRPPFSGGSAVATASQHLSTPPPDLGTLRPDAPHALVKLVGQLLVKDPLSRPGNATDVAARLRSFAPMPAPDAAAATADTTMAIPVAGPLGATVDSAGFDSADFSTSAGTDATRGRRSRARRRKPSRNLPTATLLAGAGVVILLLITAFALLSGDEEPNTGSGHDIPVDSPFGSPGPSPSPTVTPTPTASPTPTPTPTQSSRAASNVDGAVAALRQAIDSLSGGPARKPAKELSDRLRTVVKKIDEGKYEDAAERLSELRKKVTDYAEEGRLSDEQASRIRSAAKNLASLLPADDD